MKFPTLKLNLRDWSTKDFKYINKNISKLERIDKPFSHQKKGSKNQLDQIKDFFLEGNQSKLLLCLNNNIEIRYLMFLISEKENTLKDKASLSSIVARIMQIAPIMGKRSFSLLIRGLLRNAEVQNKLKEDLISYALKQLDYYSNQNSRHKFIQFALKYKDLLLAENPSKKIVEYCYAEKIDIIDLFNSMTLKWFDYKSFYLNSILNYYQEILEQEGFSNNYEAFSKFENLLVGNVYQLNLANSSKKIGHILLEKWIDDHEETLPISIKNIVIKIAGDPRVPESHSSYQIWWRKLGVRRTAKVKKWLSKMDLQTFLTILEEYGRSSGKNDMVRMLSERKSFLNELHSQNLVMNSRLFLNRGAESYLQSHFKSEDLPEFGRLKSTEKCLIYLQLGPIHIIEGSHNSKLWVFQEISKEAKILNYSINEFTVADFYPSSLNKKSGNIIVKSFAHSGNFGNWMQKVGNYLVQSGVPFKIQDISHGV